MQNVAKYKYLFALFDLFVYILLLDVLELLTKSNHKVTIGILGLSSYNSFWLLIFLLPIFYYIFYYNNLYKLNIVLDRSAHTTALIKSLLYFIPFIILFNIIVLNHSLHCTITTTFFCIVTFLLVFYIFRVVVLKRIYLFLRRNGLSRNVLIVGNGGSGELLAAKLSFENPFGINVVGFIDERLKTGEEVIGGKKVLGNITEISEIVNEKRINEIIIADDSSEYDELLNTLDICKGTKAHVKFTSNLFEIIPQKIFTERYAEIPIVNVSPNSNNIVMLRLKSIFDKVASFIGLIFLSPFMTIISILIKISSPGPVFYKHERIGKNGKPFMFYKFRTMNIIENDDDTERKEMMINFMKGIESNGSNKKVINPKRVTKIGKFLRKTSLDELPQLLNVLKGDMSLVGPRPCLPYEYENLENWQKRRFTILPGCTGMWQVTGRSEVTFQESVVLDLYYINNLSPWLDLQLLMKTVPVMLFGKGGD
jgi:exopolysaccharide biosynthesis polyprenyl glycosylphosphotransferase